MEMIRELQLRLTANGFPVGPVDGALGPQTKAAVARYQTAYAGPRELLVIDGIPGPKTRVALEELPQLAPHFVVSEVACRHCGKAYVRRELLDALELLRARRGGPLRLASAYRCPEHNRAVGGALHSMHLSGLAADLDLGAPGLSVGIVVALWLFSGIGDRAGRASHVDLRHLSDVNLTASTPERPARWHYPS